MKRFLAAVLVLLLSGCGMKNPGLDRIMELRADLLTSKCSFDAVITADYGDNLYTFSLSCQGDSSGNVRFQVVKPESIAGISGTISDKGGLLTFDDAALAFELLADGQISPVSSPWILLRTLRGGYVTACAEEGDGLQVSINDSYEEDALYLDIRLDGNNHPISGEILWDGRRIISIQVENFEIL